MVERVLLVYRTRGRLVDGIRDHGQRLADELSRRAIEVEMTPEEPVPGRSEVGSWVSVWRRLRRADRSVAVVVQYNPFSFGRWGFAPWLPAMLLSLRLRRRRPLLAVMVHEPYVPMKSLRWTVMGLWQRLQLTALRLSADVVFTSTDTWSDRFRANPPRRPAHHLPVGSNLPDRRGARGEERRREQVDADTIAVAAIGRTHETWLGEYVVEAVNEIAARGHRVVLLLLGAEAPVLPGLSPEVEVRRTGYLEADELSAKLAAADIYLAPLSDGLTTKRSAVMAALQHELPVVATEGPMTDSILRRSHEAIALTPVGRPREFAEAAARIAESADGRRARAMAARDLYERKFDWPVVGERMLAAL